MREVSSFKPEKIRRDVDVVKENAIAYFQILGDDCVNLQLNKKKARLGVIGIIGPSSFCGKHFEEVLLCEIGVGRTRPYTEARGLKRTEEESNIVPRKKVFFLSAKQYQLVAPMVFSLIEKLSLEKVLNWKTGQFSDNPFVLPVMRRYWSRRDKALLYSEKLMEALKGTRFTVSRQDTFFLCDVYWAEANNNTQIKEHLKGLVNFTDLRLSWYEATYNYRGKKAFRKLKGIRELENNLRYSSLPRYLLLEVASLIKNQKKNRFWPYIYEMISEIINWDGKPMEEKDLISAACSNPDFDEPYSRLKKIQLRVTTGLEKEKNYIVFEVFPKK